jgi:hypothetical protein
MHEIVQARSLNFKKHVLVGSQLKELHKTRLRVCLQSLLCHCNGSHEFLGRIGREMKMHHSILEVKSGMMTGSIQDLLYPKEFKTILTAGKVMTVLLSRNFLYVFMESGSTVCNGEIKVNSTM